MLLNFVLAVLPQSDPLFAQVRVQAGDNPARVLALDVSGDGIADLVTANANSDDVTVLVSRGGGAFAPAVSHPVGHEPEGLAAGDLDQDGLQDLVVVCVGDAELAVLLGQGAGGFGPASTVPTGPYPHHVALGDVDGDGVLDAAVSLEFFLGSGVQVFPGDGTGAFGPPAFVAAGERARDLALGDANADGTPDLWLTTIGFQQRTGALELSLGTGGGSFAPPWVAALGPFPDDVELADLDQDGDLDAAVAQWDFLAPIEVLAGDGSGGLAAPVGFPAGTVPRSLAIADLDGDGDCDLVVADYAGDGRLHVLANLGGLAFAAPVSFAAGNNCGSVAVADVTGDGDLDAALTNFATASGYPGAVTLVSGLADLAAPEMVPIPGLPDTNDVDLADLDGDGALDLVSTSPLGVAVQLGAAGAFGPPILHAVGPAPLSTVLADFDGDGVPDAAATSHGVDVVAVTLGDGAGGFGAATEHATSAGPRVPAAGDLDGDGALDLVVACEGFAVDVLRGDGHGGFGPSTSQPGVGGARAVALGDLNGDGALDVAVAGEGTYHPILFLWNFDGAGVVHMGDGAAGLGPPTTLSPVIHGAGVALADVEQDGYLDVAYLEQVQTSFGGRGRVLVHHGDGSGGFPSLETIAPYGAYGSATALAAGDLDRDGDVDFAVRDRSFGSLIVHRNDGGGAWQPLEFLGFKEISFAPAAVTLALADVDQDGFVDVVGSGGTDGPALHTHLGAEPAGLVPFGSGTPGCMGVQPLGASRAPALGAADFALTGTNAPPHAVGLAAVGVGQDAAGTPVFGVLFHVALAAPIPILLPIASDGAGAAFAPLPIPSQPALAGATVYAQALWPWPATAACAPSPLLWSTTRGLAIAIP